MQNILLSKNPMLAVLLFVFIPFIILLTILISVSSHFKKNKRTVSSRLKEYIELNGIETEAEVLGYTRYDVTDHLNSEYSYSAYNTVLRFTDENGIEHITIDPLNGHVYIPYNIGDIVTVKYVDNESITDDTLKAENTRYRNIITNYRQVYYKGYYSELNEDINLTDEKRCILFYI